MTVSYVLHDGQAKAAPFAASAASAASSIEAIENVGQVLLGDTDAVVPDF